MGMIRDIYNQLSKLSKKAIYGKQQQKITINCNTLEKLRTVRNLTTEMKGLLTQEQVEMKSKLIRDL